MHRLPRLVVEGEVFADRLGEPEYLQPSRPWLALKAPAYCQKLAIHDARRIASNIAKLRELLGKV